MKAIFLTTALGDYHTARLNRVAVHLAAAGVDFLAIVLNRQRSEYQHRKLRKVRDDFPTFATSIIHQLGHGVSGKIQANIRLFKALYTAKPDLIITIGYSFSHSIIALIYAKIFGVKIVFCADSKFDDGIRSPGKEMAKKILVSRFDGAIVAGSRHALYYRFLGLPKSQIRVGYDVIDNQIFGEKAAYAKRKKELVKKNFGFPQRYIVCVSRLIERKRVDVAIKAYIASRAPAENVDLVIIGSGALHAQLVQQAESSGFGSQIHFISMLPNRAMPYVYALAEFLILLSEYDQWGLCLSEALACGTPVICTPACGAAYEIVAHGENGYICGESVQAATASIDLLLDPAVRHVMSQSALSSVGQWGLDRFADNVMAFVEESLKKNRQGVPT